MSVIAAALEKAGEIASQVSEKVSKVVEASGDKIENLIKGEGFIKDTQSGRLVQNVDIKTTKTTSLESLTETNKPKMETTTPEVDKKPPEYYAVKEATGMSDATLSRCEISKDGKSVTMKCINAEKVGMNTKPPYVEKIVDVNGVKVRWQVVDLSEYSVFDTKLPKELWKALDDDQFEYCTKQLQKAIENNPSLAKQFTTEQLEQIRKGEARIKGYTWHHDAECGKMQLVKSDVHMLNRHTGGKAIWGGGRN